MTVGRPGQPGVESVRWVRERLLGLGLSDDHVVQSPLRLPPRLGEPDLEPASYLPEFSLLVQRVQRLLGTGRGLSIYITGGRGDELARAHTALQIALGIAPTGRQVVLVDADFLRPGLGGLVADSTAEGVIDLVRFGRSTRSLLLRPVPEGPWLLPAGSFPVEDPVPLAPDALRSVVYRVSQICDLALYVGPLPIRSELHPLARVCDHVVYVAPEDAADGAATLVDAVAQLQQQNAHVAGIVLYAPEAVPAPRATTAGGARFSPGFLHPPVTPEPSVAPLPVPPVALPPMPAAVTPATTSPWTESPRPASDIDWSRIGLPPLDAPADAAPTLPPSRPDAAQHATPAAASEEFRESLPALPPLELPPLELPGTRPPLPRQDSNAEADEESTELIERTRRELAETVALRRPRDEAREFGRELEPPSGEFAFEEESRDSRWPLFLVIALLVTIVVFVSWALWGRQGRSPENVPSPVTQQTSPPPSATTPPPVEPAPQASSESKPPATSGATDGQTTPAGQAEKPVETAAQEPVVKPPAPVVTPPTAPPRVEPDDRAAAGAPADREASGVEPKPTPVQPPVPAPTPAPAPPPPAASSATAGAAPYAVWVASYKTMKQAQKDIDGLHKHGYEAQAIQTDLVSKGVWFRVYVGSYGTVEEANAVRDKLLALPEYDFAQVRRLPRD